MAFDAGDANFFRYVWNNPTNATDPKGTDIVKVEPHFAGADPQPNEQTIKDALTVDNREIIARLDAVIKELDKALLNPQPNPLNPFSPQAIADREHMQGLTADRFKEDYRWALEQVRKKLQAIKSRMNDGYTIGYYALGSMTPGGRVVDDDLSGWTSKTNGDYTAIRINITQVGFNRNDIRFSGLPEEDKNGAMIICCRNTILHELSHLVLDTEDYHGDPNKYPQDEGKRHISYRVLDDAYWYEGLYKTNSMQDDFATSMNKLIKDMVRPEYLEWLRTRARTGCHRSNQSPSSVFAALENATCPVGIRSSVEGIVCHAWGYYCYCSCRVSPWAQTDPPRPPLVDKPQSRVPAGELVWEFRVELCLRA